MTGGFGSLTRKEDARFVRGRGTFVDDVVRPGMLHGAVLRSPPARSGEVWLLTAGAV